MEKQEKRELPLSLSLNILYGWKYTLLHCSWNRTPKLASSLIESNMAAKKKKTFRNEDRFGYDK